MNINKENSTEWPVLHSSPWQFNKDSVPLWESSIDWLYETFYYSISNTSIDLIIDHTGRSWKISIHFRTKSGLLFFFATFVSVVQAATAQCLFLSLFFLSLHPWTKSRTPSSSSSNTGIHNLITCFICRNLFLNQWSWGGKRPPPGPPFTPLRPAAQLLPAPWLHPFLHVATFITNISRGYSNNLPNSSLGCRLKFKSEGRK